MRDYYKEAREFHEKEKYEEALKLYEQGIAAGDEKCWYGYAILLKEGNGISADSESAMSILREHFDAILALANSGDVAAMRIVGFYYYNGYALEANEPVAFKWFEKSANAGDVGAMCSIACCFEDGDGVEQNYEEAIKWYTKSAEQGNAYAQFSLGFMYNKGQGVEQNYEEAIKWYTKSAEQGDAGAECNLGFMYNKGIGVEQNYGEGVKWFAKAAEQGDATAQAMYALNLFHGRGVEQNYEEATKWYTKSAEQGHAYAQFSLGLMYEKGQGVEQNYEEAIKWYTKSADQGNAVAQFNLGLMYEKGQGVEQNYEEAIKWYTKSAEQGDADAQYNLGFMYEDGQGVEQSYARARHWYEKAAESGDASAFFNLGELYFEGLGVDTSLPKAIEFWQKSVENENDICKEAAYRLGYAYYDGFGVEQNLEKAKEYFELAFKNGYSCSYAIDMVKYELSNREINKKSAQENGDNEMRKYAEKIIKKKNFYLNLVSTVSRDLEKDFGDTWEKLQSDTQKSLVTAMHDYITHYPSREFLEFNSTINGICRALEIELGKILYTGYIKYLIEQNIDPNSFPKNRSFLKQISKNECSYRNPEDVSNFTLGSIKLLVGLDKEPMFEAQLLDSNEKRKQAKAKNKIDKTIVDYMRYICREDAFGDIGEDRAISDYLIYFTQEIGAIADSLRNPAAHANIIKCEKAEVCGNYIIKVKKILKHFLEKIDVDKINKLQNALN